MITSAQLRAARNLIGLSQGQVAQTTGLSVPTVKRAESEKDVPVSRAAVDAIRKALENAGVIFIAEDAEGAGVRLRKSRQAEGLRPEELNAANDD
jgi:transcriptional regulator with XRE-family HTH domain